jgi:hypothetical protein
MKQRLALAETKLEAAKLQHSHLHQARSIFKGADSFPVMQTNGQLVDLYQVITAWTSKTDEDGHNPHRTYGCPITSTYTNLCQFPILNQIQSFATKLGLRLEPPVSFERRIGDEWTLMSMRTQIQLSARVCFLYANRSRFVRSKETSTIITDDEQLIVTFRLESVEVTISSNYQHSFQCILTPLFTTTQDDESPRYTLYCKGVHQSIEQAIRIRITRPRWNPFNEMVFEGSVSQADIPSSPCAAT